MSKSQYRVLLIVVGLVCLFLTAGCAHNQAAEKGDTLQGWLDEHDKKADGEMDFDQHLAMARSQYSKGDYESAYLHYSKALTFHPEDVELRLMRADILVKRGLMEKALNEYMALYKLNNDDKKACLGVGKVYFSAGMYEKAKVFLKQASTGACDYSLADNLLGVIANWEGQPEIAKSYLMRAYYCDVENGEVLNNLGLSYLLLEEYELAAGFFRKAIRHGNTAPRVFNNLGLALAKSDRYTEAFEAFRSASSEAQAYNNIGYVLYLKGELDEAIKCFEMAIKLHSTYYKVAEDNLKRARTAMLDSRNQALLPILNTEHKTVMPQND